MYRVYKEGGQSYCTTKGRFESRRREIVSLETIVRQVPLNLKDRTRRSNKIRTGGRTRVSVRV